MQKRVDREEVVTFSPKAMADRRKAIAAMSYADRDAVFANGKRAAVMGVVDMAIVVALDEEEGREPTYAMSDRLRGYLLAVAHGDYHPATYFYLNNTTVMGLFSRLALSEQAKVIEAEAVEVRKSPKTVDTVRLDALTATDVRKLVDPVTKSVKPAAKQDATERGPRAENADQRFCCWVDYGTAQEFRRLAADRGQAPDALLKTLLKRELSE